MRLQRDRLRTETDGPMTLLPWSDEAGERVAGRGLAESRHDPTARETAGVRFVFLLAMIVIQADTIANLGWHGVDLVSVIGSFLCIIGCVAWIVGWIVPWRYSPHLALAGLLVMGTFGALLSGLLTNHLGASPAFPAAAAVVITSRWPTKRAAIVIGWFLLVLVAAAATRGWSQLESNGLGYGSLFLGMFGLGVGRRAYILRAESAEKLVQETERANHEQAHAAALAERSRIAREIHDVLAHSLAALTVQLEAADALLESGNEGGVERAHAYVQKSRRIAREGLVETRRAIAALREDAPPLPELLHGLADAYRGDTGAQAYVEIQGLTRPVQADAGLTVYRAAQESLTNVRKHAPGATVRLKLVYGNEEVILTVANGAATEPPSALAESGGGYGLAGLKERAELIGGSLEAGPYAAEDLGGPGWRVILRVNS
ncbi:sensor histidine kinase [Actinospica sp. MGRD01-02]|uniref:histidine kinase n=1 Tax=Actinospica acidithermotolerans TaxID=2828514 RepID=A0A941EKW7_9ACTN|nr:sensor histidine kinase [Actinospica acidithermotolerans]MBR7829459.1 sensor histidine kinase [Actinospica acidithermotolerans]